MPAILAGATNAVPTDGDIYSTHSWLKHARRQPQPRGLYTELVAHGWTEAVGRTVASDLAVMERYGRALAARRGFAD